jgi:hypothetical protein
VIVGLDIVNVGLDLAKPYFYKSCSVATLEHSEPLLLENHVRIVALTPDLQRVSFYSVTEFLHHSSTTELLPCLIHIKGLSTKVVRVAR